MNNSTPGDAPAATGGPAGRPIWTAPRGVSDKRTWASLAVLLVGLFMSLLDTTIVNVALPSIRDSINADEATLAWIISGYALAFGLVLIPAGRVGDRIGHKWVFLTGLALFTAASLFAGISQDSTQLIVARVFQGLGGGIFFPPVTAFIQLLFPPMKRGKAFAVLGAVLGVSAALGPVVGGLLIEAFGVQSGWRYIFFVNLPIGIGGLVAAAIVLPKLGRGRKSSMDLFGLLLLAGSLVAILVPLIQGQEEGWPLWTYLSIAGGLVLLVLFALWERRLASRGRSPLVPPHLYSHAAFTGGTILALVYFAAFTSIFFTISLLWQAGLGHTALESGLVSIPFAIGSIIGASQSDRVAVMLGRGVLVLGASMVLAGLVSLWLILLNVPGSDLTSWTLLGPLAVAGLGSGFFIAPNNRFIVATVDTSEAGAASGVIGTMQRIGSAIGIAVVSSVLFGVTNLAGVGGEIRQKVAAALEAGTYASPELAGEAISKIVLEAHFMEGATVAMFVSAMFAVAALALVFTLPKRVQLH
ncbi:MAG: MFS transporter [Rhodoglobus sp.]